MKKKPKIVPKTTKKLPNSYNNKNTQILSKTPMFLPENPPEMTKFKKKKKKKPKLYQKKKPENGLQCDQKTPQLLAQNKPKLTQTPGYYLKNPLK